MRNLEGLVDKGFVPNECHKKDKTSPDFSIPGIGWRRGWPLGLCLGLILWFFFGSCFVPLLGAFRGILIGFASGLIFGLFYHIYYFCLASQVCRRRKNYKLSFPKDSSLNALFNDICDGNLQMNTSFFAKAIALFCENYPKYSPMEVLLSLNTDEEWKSYDIMLWIMKYAPSTTKEKEIRKKKLLVLLNKMLEAETQELAAKQEL